MNEQKYLKVTTSVRRTATSGEVKDNGQPATIIDDGYHSLQVTCSNDSTNFTAYSGQEIETQRATFVIVRCPNCNRCEKILRKNIPN